MDGPQRHTPRATRRFPKLRYALIELEQPIGDRDFDLKMRTTVNGKRTVVEKRVRLGYWGDSEGFKIPAVQQKHLNGVKMFSAGYPRDFGKSLIRVDGQGFDDALKERIRELMPDDWANVLAHRVDAIEGQSGSPLWRHVERDGTSVCELVGVVIQKGRDFNYAVAMTEEVLEQIVSWAPKTFELKDGFLSVMK